MIQPRIAIVANKSTELSESYRFWLSQAGTNELEIFYANENETEFSLRLNRCDALVLTGGGDFAPESKAYADIHELQTTKIYGVNLQRDHLEQRLLDWAFEKNKPLFAICRGFQSLNVFCGGSLMPDIFNRLKERADPAHRITSDELAATNTPPRFHPLNLLNLSPLFQTLSLITPLITNSFHHQAIDRLGQGLVVEAVAPDGIIEAISYPQNPKIIAVQFHPERMVDFEWVVRWSSNWIKQI